MDRKNEFRKLRVRGLTYREIGERFGISRQRVHQILNNTYKIKKTETDKEKLIKYNARKEYQRNWARERGIISPKFRLNRSLSTLIWKALVGKKAGRKWQKLVGYSINDLMECLERQFDDKMNWDNYGNYWEVDHIKPRSLFNYKNSKDKEFKECWSLSNLQPLEKTENRRKYNFWMTKSY